MGRSLNVWEDEIEYTTSTTLEALDSPEPVVMFPFVVPEVEHFYADEMMRILADFSVMGGLPEFDSVDNVYLFCWKNYILSP